ncbi:MAG TPA: hypothetical protein VM451_01125 [Candidatus Limnocylindria bacterium]|nr:hypothetical protein [Candidatus Limnocylindria bacterium]
MADGELESEAPRTLRIELQVDTEDDVPVLRGALIAARATELAEIHRRDLRQAAGYGSDVAREGMTAEVRHHQRRRALLDRLIEAIRKEER